jgi:hypothetical protein
VAPGKLRCRSLVSQSSKRRVAVEDGNGRVSGDTPLVGPSVAVLCTGHCEHGLAEAELLGKSPAIGPEAGDSPMATELLRVSHVGWHPPLWVLPSLCPARIIVSTGPRQCVAFSNG